MKINFEIISTILEPFITIHAAEKTPQLVQLSDEIQQLSNSLNLTGYRDTKRKMISVLEINRIQTSGKRVICQTLDGEYELHQRIYELASTLPHNLFIRTSSSEIIRIAWIKEFVLTPTGMYQIILRDGQQTYTSRRYTREIRKELLS
ncbi:hypothetical protein LROSL1_2504 [Furfurilactobacillus rossiae]|uniref:LytTR family DNA-binding domain-containing protein n=1 Tax=Furfurilactobacillus rossiae TaxID=231049 RepID=UPI0015C0F2B8|nr:LytTR family DNA-binding domain-containing protein [Furfurilactobacillus rossiae]MCF6165217.1 LytTR family transcriptional regulator [Furfurilactobacillus rossiae]QLE65304.1 hypothetical protein LROSL1_2504 [Furfurilactobacillus rossiae]